MKTGKTKDDKTLPSTDNRIDEEWIDFIGQTYSDDM